MCMEPNHQKCHLRVCTPLIRIKTIHLKHIPSHPVPIAQPKYSHRALSEIGQYPLLLLLTYVHSQAFLLSFCRPTWAASSSSSWRWTGDRNVPKWGPVLGNLINPFHLAECHAQSERVGVQRTGDMDNDDDIHASPPEVEIDGERVAYEERLRATQKMSIVSIIILSFRWGGSWEGLTVVLGHFQCVPINGLMPETGGRLAG